MTPLPVSIPQFSWKWYWVNLDGVLPALKVLPVWTQHKGYTR